MRITNGMMVNNLMRNISLNLNRMDRTQRQLASGKKFTRPSDDPIGVSRSLRLNTEVATMEQYKRNADDINSWLTTTEMAISNINEVLKRAKELTVQAASETNSVNEREAIAKEIKELRNQLVQIGNTTYAGSYIFSGYKTDKPLLNDDGTYNIGGGNNMLSLDEVIGVNVGIGDKLGMNFVGQRIFGLHIDGVDDLSMEVPDSYIRQQSINGKYINPVTDPITGPISFQLEYKGITATIDIPAVTYDNFTDLTNAITSELSADFGTDVTVTVVDNKLVFKADDEFRIKNGSASISALGLSAEESSSPYVKYGDASQLIRVFDDLVAGLEADDTDVISKALARIDIHSNNVNALRAEVGVKTNRIELTNNRILDDTLNLRDLLSKNEDADIAEVVMNLQMQEYVYKASLAGGARIIQPTLVDFIR